MVREKVCGIYKITSPTGKIYIGQSVDVYYRFLKYSLYDCKKQRKLYCSLKRHGVKNHKFEILELVDSKLLNEKEVYYINLFKSFNSEFGLNLTSGGDSRGAFSEESKKRCSIAQMGNKKNLGKKRSIETRKKMSEWQIGRVMSEDAKEKIRLHAKSRISPRLGKKHSDETKNKIRLKALNMSIETKLKISNSRKSYKASNETRGKLKLKRIGRKPYCKIVIDINTGVFYDSVEEVANLYLLSKRKLWKMLSGEQTNKTSFIHA